MERQPIYELRLLPGSLSAAALGGPAFLLASTDLYLLPDPGAR